LGGCQASHLGGIQASHLQSPHASFRASEGSPSYNQMPSLLRPMASAASDRGLASSKTPEGCLKARPEMGNPGLSLWWTNHVVMCTWALGARYASHSGGSTSVANILLHPAAYDGQSGSRQLLCYRSDVGAASPPSPFLPRIDIELVFLSVG
jgi:hypothetical protein